MDEMAPNQPELEERLDSVPEEKSQTRKVYCFPEKYERKRPSSTD